MTPTQKQFHDILNDSALQYIMRDIDVMSDRPHTDAEKAETLTRLAKDAPELLEQEIRRLQGKIDLIRTYLPPLAGREAVMKLNGPFYWIGDSDLTIVKQEGGEDVFAMSKRLHGTRLIENTIQVVEMLNAGRAALQEGKQ